MNIAHSLNKPAVPRGKKRRRVRRLKFAFRLFVLLVFLVSAGFAAYWTFVGVGMLWRTWAAPVIDTAWSWLHNLSSAERFMWLNHIGWGAVGIGILTSFWVYVRKSRFAKWVTLICFTYTYAFLWYVLWLALQSFFDMNGWTENGLIGLAVISYVCIIGTKHGPRSAPTREETS